MSIPGFGRIMPIHGYVLALVGWELSRGGSELITSDVARIERMREGHAELVRKTGEDFGFDLGGWRDFLLRHPEGFGYRHPYAFSTVDRAVRTAIADPNFQALAIRAEIGGREWHAKHEAERERERQAHLDAIAARDARITRHTCPFCAKPCPSYRVTCKQCGKQVRDR